MIEEGCLTSDLFSMGCTIDPTNMQNCDIRAGAFLECRDLLWPFAGKSYIFISICELRPMHAALQCVVSQVDGCGECSISPLWSSDLPGQANHHAIYMGWMYFFKKVNSMQIDLHLGARWSEMCSFFIWKDSKELTAKNMRPGAIIQYLMPTIT